MREPLTYVRNLLRGNRYARGELSQGPGHGNPPVLLLHGYLGTRGAMYLLERRLLRDGFEVFSFPLGVVNTGDVRRSAAKVRDRVQAILSTPGVDTLDVVAHSMGGLIALYYIQELGGREVVRRMVSLGTPYKGTWTAFLGLASLGLLAPSSLQLIPGSRFIQRLVDKPLPPEVRFFSVRGTEDRICPFPTTHLPGAQELIVATSHSGLVTEAVSYKAVFQCLTGE